MTHTVDTDEKCELILIAAKVYIPSVNLAI
jgi:hypothetical protein